MVLVQRITVILLIFTFFSYALFSQNFHDAVEKGDLAVVRKILKKNPGLAVQVNRLKVLPISTAILNGHTEVAKVLISHMSDMAKLDIKDVTTKTPLIHAASAGNMEVAKLLIAKGADLDLQNVDGRSPLYYAAWQEKEKMVALLIKSGARVNTRTDRGGTPLRIAIQRRNRNIIDLLVTGDARLDIDDKDDGVYLLHQLASLGYHKLVKDLIGRGVDKHSRDKTRRTLLHNAATGGLDNLMADLIKQSKQGGISGTSDVYGSTPLHEAVFHGHKDTVAFLLANGANINLPRPDGTMPLHIAREVGNREMIDLLLKKGAIDKPKVFPELTGDYLGQKEPGKTGVIFAPGIISKAGSHDAITGFFDNKKIFIFSKYPIGLRVNWTQWPNFLMKKTGDKWAEPYQSKLVGKPWFFDLQSVPVGERMIFAWKKNLDGSGSATSIYLWSSIKTVDGWSTPVRFPPPVNQGFDTWPSLSADKTLYFHSRRDDSFGRSDIYMSKLEKGEYKRVKNLGKNINTSYTEHDPFVAPDGSYLLFSSYKSGGYGKDDMYISYRKADGSWTKSINLGAGINSKYSDNRVYVSPDGKYLFYTSTRTGNLDIYWVDASIIKELKPKNLE